MRKLNIPNTHIKISQVIYGTGSIHKILSDKNKLKILNYAYELGINHFDTSPYYGYGISEKILGVFKKDKKDITFSSKVGLYPSFKESSRTNFEMISRKIMGRINPKISLAEVNWNILRAKSSLEKSLKSLNTEALEILLLHEPELGLVKFDEFLEWLEYEKVKGNILSYGLAGKSKNITKILEKYPFKFSIIQSDKFLERKDKKQLSLIYSFLRKNINLKGNDLNRKIKSILNSKIGLIVSSNNKNHLKNISNNWQ